MFRCWCGRTFLQKKTLSAHKSHCSVVLAASTESHEAALRHAESRPTKRARFTIKAPPWAQRTRDTATTITQEQARLDWSQVLGEVLENETGLDQVPQVAEVEVAPVDDDVAGPSSRFGRRIRPTWKLRDALPEEPGVEVDEGTHDDHDDRALPRPRFILLATQYIRTKVNTFSLRRFYKRPPRRTPQVSHTLGARPGGTPGLNLPSQRQISDIIFPFPNISSFRFAWHSSGASASNKKTRADRGRLRKMLLGKDFKNEDIADTDFDKIEEILSGDADIGELSLDARQGWRKTPLTVGVPSGKKPTQASRREAATVRRRINRHEPFGDVPAARPVPGFHLPPIDFYHKSVCDVIRSTMSSDPASAEFVFDPFLVEKLPPGSSKPERVYGELYNSSAFVQEDLRLQNSPPIPGCPHPRCIVALMFASDATVVTQFGNSKVWPGYMYFGNQSKYTRARPSAHAAHHVAYFPELPPHVQDFFRQLNEGKSMNAALLTHCRRELFHSAWSCLLDDEFLDAYQNGIVVECYDGVTRRLFPRIFTYSGDYPEKMLIATLRDKGQCPCPHCLIRFDKIHQLGTTSDRETRILSARMDTEQHQALVTQARHRIYEDGYVVDSDRVEGLLRQESMNAFHRLSKFGFNIQKALVVDQMHEFELGVWKALFKHLVRILDSLPGDAIHVMNSRFRQVPSFGAATIHKFCGNVCELKHMAARDLEDILQTIIPCIEGLLPPSTNESVLTLLFVCAYWHALAKMRLHSDSSLDLLDDTTALLGHEMRYFAAITCPQFDARETAAEYQARRRAEERRNPTSIAANDGRRLRLFTAINTIKFHFLGEYVSIIRELGTTDSFTTEINELSHREVKARRQRTNNVNPDGQLVKLDAYENRLRLMAEGLRSVGVEDIPGLANHARDTAQDAQNPLSTEAHHDVAESEKNPVDVRDWKECNPHDVAIQSFMTLLLDHLRQRLSSKFPALDDPAVPVILRQERIYKHEIMRINYTTYDVRRDQDILHPKAGKADVVVAMGDSADDPPDSRTDSSPLPWLYARVLGIYHANVCVPGPRGVQGPERVDFLHVRWFRTDPFTAHGALARRLERIQYISHTEDTPAFGLVDPASVIRVCHLIPAFHHQRTTEYLSASSARDHREGDWRYYYVNRHIVIFAPMLHLTDFCDRFVDRDMFTRHAGCGLGHLPRLKAETIETILKEGFNADEPVPEQLAPDQQSDNQQPQLGPLNIALDNMADDSSSDTERMDRALASTGAAMGLMADLFRDFQAIIDIGVSANPNTPSSSRSRSQQKLLDLFECLISMAPWIPDELAKRGPHGSFEVARKLDAGRQAVRATDLHETKKQICCWDVFTPPLDQNSKDGRGFYHDRCGELLCPPDYNWSDPTVQTGIRAHSDKYIIGPGDLPRLLWRDETVDENNLHKGFCMGDLLLKAGRSVLIGPRSAMKTRFTRAARKPKARIYNVRSITPAFIAYTAVLVHYALSSQDGFGNGSSPRSFQYELFYHTVVRQIETSMLDEEREHLLAWWTKECLGEQWDDDENDTSSHEGDCRPSMASRMAAQGKARKRASV
ncbi:uncharacterized protein BXZ73DRAFT_105780 [Epithele typhae]|uniref:uncharacterized protein n=1 Tax=Epithele typhae TaxID=378194 RepID=UPI0020080D9B|nr:uncharacterized protein BXZ73DRAFT_105780 [Epithele typhae]KAH9916588.1 hypothetical protein BXZ73DRAFT_105780 [Epithele typhae]